MRYFHFRRLSLGFGRVEGYEQLFAGYSLSWDYYQRQLEVHAAGVGLRVSLIRRRSRLEVQKGSWGADWWRKP